MILKKLSVLFLVVILSCFAISVSAFDGDYMLLQKNIFEQNNEQKLIIENKLFYLRNFLIAESEETKEENISEISFVQLLAKAEEFKSEKELAKKNADMYSKGVNIKYPFYITYTTIEEYDYILKGTNLEGYGYCFKMIEEEYGVNGLFAMAVATQESGLGRSALAKSNNNFYGMKSGSTSWAKFNSKESGILYFGKLMNKSLYKGKTISQIAPIYCNEEWGGKVSSIITRYVNRIEVFNNEKVYKG